jgi:hypothetical protein
MSRYASQQTYGGRRAYIAAPVVVSTAEHGLGSGTIAEIHNADGIDDLYIAEIGEVGVIGGLTFHPTTTAEDIEAMPVGCWTWPVRV